METSEREWKNIYRIGAAATILVLAGIILDVVAGNVTGGNISQLPHTATDRFNQFRESALLGLYNLDLLNVINQIVLIPSVFALYSVHRETGHPSALFALILFLVGSTIFICGNTALSMLDLSRRYFNADSEGQKLLIAAAGEAMLAKGSHGNLGVFIGFVLPGFANALMSGVMLKGRIFSRLTSWTGIISNSMMVIYIIMVTFIPSVGQMATAFAMPGGLMVMAWMIMYTGRLIKLSKT